MERAIRPSSVDWTEFCAETRAARTFVVMGHVRPDGDTIGSILAMKRALVALGKEVLLVDGHSVPPGLAFIDPNREVRKIEELTDAERAFAASADVVMTVDVSSWGQLGPDATALFQGNPSAKKLVVDHHAVGDSFGDVRCVDASADSAGSLVFEAIRALGVSLTKEIADALFVAISTDTGWFRFGSTTAETLSRVAALVDAGVQIDAMYRELNEQESYGRFKLFGEVALGCERFLDGKGIFMRLSQKDFAEAGAIMSDSEDLVNEPLRIAGTEVAVIAVEQKDGTVKASFRSRCAMDCANLAREFGGGGHARAAGATLATGLEDACMALKQKTAEFYAASKAEEARKG
ncbi:MAG: DHH family phosphoesterase [Thermoguttaceae bacterium]|nr:DHH family phosphoesterase [Thermoguttaceae bacterium]